MFRTVGILNEFVKKFNGNISKQTLKLFGFCLNGLCFSYFLNKSVDKNYGFRRISFYRFLFPECFMFVAEVKNRMCKLTKQGAVEI